MNKHKGKRIQVYLRENDLEKLDNLSTLSKFKTRSDTIRMLIRGTPFIDKSFKECLGELGKIGSLIKNKNLLPPQELKNLLNEIKILKDFAYGKNSN